MAFTHKNLLKKSHNLSILKGLTLFFLGASIAVLAANALSIDPVITNAVQYIQKIVLTSDGSVSGVTGIVLDGDSSSFKLSVFGEADFREGSRSVSIKNDPGLGLFGASAQIYLNSNTSDRTGLIISHFYNNGVSNINNFDGTLGLGATSFGALFPNLILQTGGTVDVVLGLNVGLVPGGFLSVNGTGTFSGLIVDGNVGIGTSSPSAKFEVDGNVKINGKLGIGDDVPSSFTNYDLYVGLNAIFGLGEGTGEFLIQNVDDFNLFRINNDSKKILFDENSLGYDVGIGTDNPQANLEVHGGMKILGAMSGLALPIQVSSNVSNQILVSSGTSDRFISVRILNDASVNIGATIKLNIDSFTIVEFNHQTSSASYEYALIPLAAGKDLLYTVTSLTLGNMYLYPTTYNLGL